MKVKDAQDALLAKCKDYHKTHGLVLNALNIADDTPLSSYLEQIDNDTLEWFNVFPKEYLSVPALAKPKSAIVYLLEKHEETRNYCGAEFCDRLATKIHAVWKENRDKLLQIRVELAENEKNEADSVHDSESVVSNDHNDVDILAIDQPATTRRGTRQKAKSVAVDHQLLAKLSTLEEENEELVIATEQATETIKQLKDDQDKLVKENSALKDQLEKTASTLTMLKTLFIDIMRDKGASDTEMKLLERLLPAL